jgi:hypothetical protein
MQIIETDWQSPSTSIREINGALDAVCNELGIARFETKRRDAVAKRIEAVWRKGRTQPLDLVDAGLG